MNRENDQDYFKTPSNARMSPRGAIFSFFYIFLCLCVEIFRYANFPHIQIGNRTGADQRTYDLLTYLCTENPSVCT